MVDGIKLNRGARDVMALMLIGINSPKTAANSEPLVFSSPQKKHSAPQAMDI